jgi:S-adenosylmethionine:tRNA ribosyltransferase-isomerase
MNKKLFHYNLPKEFIAQKPVSPRDSSKLMVLENNRIYHKKFFEISEYLSKDDVLVINNSKVTPAKITGKKLTGGIVEILIVNKIKENIYSTIMKAQNKGIKIHFESGLEAEVLNRKGYFTELKFSMPDIQIYLKKYGSLPTPPYIKGKDFKQVQYQTTYAKKTGSIAAPTAGLHFTNELLEKIERKGVKIAEICLNVGLGTFLPVKVENIKEHKMHLETFTITKEASQTINNRKGRLFVVGTTSLRALEAANINGVVECGTKETEIFIYPGYKFKNKIDGMITNFHLPESTLLMLVSALVGKDKILEAYEVAKEKKYRFFSFGDAMLIIK